MQKAAEGARHGEGISGKAATLGSQPVPGAGAKAQEEEGDQSQLCLL